MKWYAMPLMIAWLLLVSAAAAADDAAPAPGAGAETEADAPSLTEPPAETFDPESELARLAPFLDDEEEAIQAVRQFDRVQQRFASWDSDLSDQYAMEGDPDLARAAAERARTRMETVRTAYERLLERYPDNARAHNFYGELHYDWLSDQAAALASWHKARELDATLAAPRNNLAIHYCHVGEYKECLGFFDEAMALEPDNPDYLFNLTQIFLIHPRHVAEHYGIERDEVYKRAMEMSGKAAKLQPNDYALAQDYAVNYFAGENFGVKVNWADAARAWQAARKNVRRTDELFYTWLNEGRVWLRDGKNREAARCFREALTIVPDSEIAQQLLARVEG